MTTPETTRQRRPRKTHGPVYAAVCEQLRAQFGTTKTRTPEQAQAFARVAGYVGSARSLASRIDRADGVEPCPNQDLSGHDCRRHELSGREVATLHEQLSRTLGKLQAEQPSHGTASLTALMLALTPGAPPTTEPLPLPGIEP